MAKIPYPTRFKLMQHFKKQLDSVELDLKDKLLLHPELDVLNDATLKRIVDELNGFITVAQIEFVRKLSEEYEKVTSSVSDAGVSTPKVSGIENFVGGAAAGIGAGTTATALAGVDLVAKGVAMLETSGHTILAKGLAQMGSLTVAEAIAAKLGVTAVAVSTAMTAGGAILAMVATNYILSEFSESEKREKVKKELLKNYDSKVRPMLEDWAKDVIDSCNW